MGASTLQQREMFLGPKLSASLILKCASKTELICENEVQLQIIQLRLRTMKQEMKYASSKDSTLQAKKGRLTLEMSLASITHALKAANRL